MIAPDPAALRAWATREGLEASSYDALLALPQVHALYEREIDAYSRELRGYERIRGLALLSEGFSTDNGMLTPTLKVSRRAVADRYRSLLDSLYAGSRKREASIAAHP